MIRTCPVCQSPVGDEDKVCPVCNFRLLGATEAFRPLAMPTSKQEQPAPQIHAYLRMVRGPQVGVKFPLDKDVIFIGRNPQRDIFLNDMTVSRDHAKVERHADALIIIDENSFNGVWVNNSTVSQHALRPGDYVQIGKYDFIYEESDDEGE